MTATAAPAVRTANGIAPSDENLLEVRDLRKHYPITAGFLKREVGAVKAVDGVNFTL